MRMKRAFTYGFTLTEQELRRICNTIDQQMQKKTNAYQQTFTLTFKNGGEEELDTLDKVLNAENSGGWLIREIIIITKCGSSNTRISVDLDTSSFTSVFLLIEDDDRDWVYVTASLIEERINRIKRPFPKIFSFPLEYALIAVGTGITIGMPLSLFTGNTPHHITISSVIALIIGPALILTGLTLANFYLIPRQLFCWGDMTTHFSKAKTIRNFIVVTLVLALLIGIISSLIASYLFKWLS